MVVVGDWRETGLGDFGVTSTVPAHARGRARLAARVQGVRRLLPKAAQDGGARRRARGAVLPVVPPRVPKDHGVARGAGAGPRVAGGALDVRANPAPPQCGAYMLRRCDMQRQEERKRGVVAAAALAP